MRLHAHWLRRSQRDSKRTRRRCSVCLSARIAVMMRKGVIDLTYCPSRHSSGSIMTHDARRTTHDARRARKQLH
ncbi:hypothetical protein KWI_0113080 [Xanthomonas vasicola pv. vasculorum NCPPB 206]|nr:hypothetical protein KWI_0113080 [Xanthomonas vasicola pv. vasculorum NCPPB 206]